VNARTKTFSLRARLTVLLALAVLVALGGAAKIVDWRADSEMQQRFDASLLARAQSLASLVQIERGGIGVASEDSAAAGFPGSADKSWYQVRCGRRVIARTAQAPPDVPVDSSPSFADVPLAGRVLRVVTLRFHRGRASAQATQPVVCVLRYALDRGPLDEILGTLDYILLGSLLGACLLVLLATPWLVRRGLRPLAVLDRAMAGIGPDAPGGRLPASDTTELAPLVARFNEVLARMDDGLARERQFASGLAHELRTRLAELRTLVEVETRYPSGHDIGSVLGEIGSIGAELEATVAALLQLTRIQSGLEAAHPQPVPLAPLLGRACTRQQDMAQARGVRIEASYAPDLDTTVATDPALLEIVLDNLLGNAVAYAPSGTAIEMHCERGIVSVTNAAPALQRDDLANFGQRFWRKGGQDAGHVGLGLALAGAAARALRMTLSFELNDGVLRAMLSWSG
jgi:signal transduction histidine kinase